MDNCFIQVDNLHIHTDILFIHLDEEVVQVDYCFIHLDDLYIHMNNLFIYLDNLFVWADAPFSQMDDRLWQTMFPSSARLILSPTQDYSFIRHKKRRFSLNFTPVKFSAYASEITN